MGNRIIGYDNRPICILPCGSLIPVPEIYLKLERTLREPAADKFLEIRRDLTVKRNTISFVFWLQTMKKLLPKKIGKKSERKIN